MSNSWSFFVLRVNLRSRQHRWLSRKDADPNQAADHGEQAPQVASIQGVHCLSFCCRRAPVSNQAKRANHKNDVTHSRPMAVALPPRDMLAGTNVDSS